MIQGFWGDLPSLQSISEDDDKGYKKRFLSFWECLARYMSGSPPACRQRATSMMGCVYRRAAEAKGRGT